MSIEIKHIRGPVLYTAESAADVRAAVIEAVKNQANLGGVNLGGANLRDAYLRGAYLRDAYLGGTYLGGANLRDAYLGGANLRDAYLRGAYLGGAYLGGANLGGANLRDANLGGANLRDAYLGGANLRDADLRGANLRDAKNAELVIAKSRILPDGDLIAWKLCRDNRIVKLRIPANAKRSHAAGRKCRAEYAEVLEITDASGKTATSAISNYDPGFNYEAGATVRPTLPFDENMWNECGSGIHFYITREEAEAHD